MRRFLGFLVISAIGLTCLLSSCKTKSTNPKKRIFPSASAARVPSDWDGRADWSSNPYTLGDAP